MCLPFLCGGRDDHGPADPRRQHSRRFSDDQPTHGPSYRGAETRNGAQANAGGWGMDNGPAHPAAGLTNNSGAAEKTGQLSPEARARQGYVAAAAGAPRHGPVAAPRPVEGWTRQGPARLFTARRAGDDDAPTAASNDQLHRGGAGDREYRSKSRG
ncbi:hypothetical protein D1007_44298 [Hordeum vulgare]|uniref:Uncharacterized protein n=1 Tax=Hordeum vulgare subsp. vulgare TaxID=112509 RepID=A0A8I6YUJ0_HORVV|nr:hypothetical protein D1007_44298 [Hordeum vulgare]KAI4975371.1 hypothetical protein ZWY2020_048978 [Hordeum vulgare]